MNEARAGSAGRAAPVTLYFDGGHRLVLVRRTDPSGTGRPVWDVCPAGIADRGAVVVPPVEVAVLSGGKPETGVAGPVPVLFGEVRVEALPGDDGNGGPVGVFSIEEIHRGIKGDPSAYSGMLRFLIPRLRPHLIRLPYLAMRDSDYIYRFRTERQRNREVYRIDGETGSLYQSSLCEAIKAIKRTGERSPDSPADLDFGPVRYILPSHFGFCLGVQNAIERAYECLAENPGRNVYMLSELIHNPFVNGDLKRRGLRYLQSDTGEAVLNPATGRPFWDEVGPEDIVVIPAFGATNEDKVRLIEKGVGINRYDATCMLVEKVWKAARRFAASGYTVIIHGKSEHEETKATFSNSAAAGPSLVIRNMDEARALGDIMLEDDPDEKHRRFRRFAGRHTPGFSPERDLERIAVVNQTTLLRNETLAIIDHLERVLVRKYGEGGVNEHLHRGSRGDTLCYATQVNQNALERALAAPLDAAVVVGGTNSSNTFQLFRMCEAVLGKSAVYIQSEENILSRARVRHYRFGKGPGDRTFEERSFLPDSSGPLRILITGGASCPDGLIQQVIHRINRFFPADSLRSIDDVLESLTGGEES